MFSPDWQRSKHCEVASTVKRGVPTCSLEQKRAASTTGPWRVCGGREAYLDCRVSREMDSLHRTEYERGTRHLSRWSQRCERSVGHCVCASWRMALAILAGGAHPRFAREHCNNAPLPA